MQTILVGGPNSDFRLAIRVGLQMRGYGITENPNEAQYALMICPAYSPDETSIPNIVQTVQTQLAQWTTSTQVEKLILISSAEVYGEGPFLCGDCGSIPTATRDPNKVGRFNWEALCPICGEMLMPIPANASHPTQAISAYGNALNALEKAFFDLALPNTTARICLRVFNPYDTAYLLASPLQRFAQSFQANEAPHISEDGCQLWDFTHLEDILQAIEKVCQTDTALELCYSIGSGTAITPFEWAIRLQEELGKTDVLFQVSEQAIPNQPRHRLADITDAQKDFGYQPQWRVSRDEI